MASHWFVSLKVARIFVQNQELVLLSFYFPISNDVKQTFGYGTSLARQKTTEDDVQVFLRGKSPIASLKVDESVP